MGPEMLMMWAMVAVMGVGVAYGCQECWTAVVVMVVYALIIALGGP